MKIYCIGIGPGGEEQMTLRAVRALEACDCVAGYGLYLDLIDSLIEGKERIQTGMTREVDRCAAALELSVSARCRLVMPEPPKDEADEDPLSRMLRERAERRKA